MSPPVMDEGLIHRSTSVFFSYGILGEQQRRTPWLMLSAYVGEVTPAEAHAAFVAFLLSC